MSAPQPQMIFVNLPVQDLEKSKAFFSPRYSFNPTYTNDDAAGMVISESIYVMLLTQPFSSSSPTSRLPMRTPTRK